MKNHNNENENTKEIDGNIALEIESSEPQEDPEQPLTTEETKNVDSKKPFHNPKNKKPYSNYSKKGNSNNRKFTFTKSSRNRG